ncbi:Phospholipid:diacylglycerol acyltransferase [Seminavis robusta]|uniref:Phospholipid:diacylglycerol acyltransferase n=1 Tax=Seminavis robusta TaxID=568900 RepID=A0A9N8E961_9STRA|nr:Phospholipid:diacylglycerol acyltransferase [Seminavis robusta]|eukprot:Sro631_g178460.1 Phospholipid:diacylglycerol acyltransferase (968) ;mRNA; r:17540-20524
MVNNTDQVKEQLQGSMGKQFRAMGFQPKHPVALFNSLSGNVIEVIESDRMPHWVAKQPNGADGGALWVDVAKVTSAAIGNITGMGHTNTKAHRIQKWHDELIHMMDSDKDGEVDTEELITFLTQTATLQDDQLIKSVLKEAEGKTTIQLLKELGPCMPKVLSALVSAKSNAEQEIQVKNKTIEYNWEASTEFAKHMQLKGGYADPDGIKVRARSGLASMECLVANDPGGVMAKLGAALMLPVTTALKDIGYQEGVNLRGYGYDWRVPCTKLEKREQYLSKTMQDIAELVATNKGQKAVVITHSLGGVMASYFFHWVAHSDYGKAHGGVQWLEEHIQAFLPVGGPMLGTPYGSHSYITGDEGQNLAPAVFSYADRHLVVRSWGMFGMIFPCGQHLMLQPTQSVHWVRRQGCLNVHVLSVQMAGEQVDKDDNTNLQYYVMAGIKHHTTGKVAKKLKCTPIQMSSHGAIDERLLFYWNTGPESVEGTVLTVSLWRDWVGPIDKELGRGTFELGENKMTVVEGPSKGETLPGLTRNEYVEVQLPLKEKAADGLEVTATVRLKFVPFDENNMHNDFRRKDDPGAYRCGGPADACTSPAKQSQLLKALGPELGKEWAPLSTKDPSKKVTYSPMSIDQMFVLDEMVGNYEAWKECYADDPIWRKHSTEPPEGVNRIRPIYGINMPTLVGNVYRRSNKRIARYQPNTSLDLDTDCKIEHDGYACNRGIITEMPHKTPQADDPTKPLSEMTFKKRCSGDGTVAYWSLRWPITWKERGYDVKMTEVEGAGHRDILETMECLETCLVESCSRPAKYVEIIMESITYTAGSSCLSCCFNVCCCCLVCLCKCIGLNTDNVFAELSWHDNTFTTEPLLANWRRGERKVESQRRFVLGVTQEDFDKGACIGLSINTAVQMDISFGPQASGTKSVGVNINDLLKETTAQSQVVKMGTSSGARHAIKWSWRWGAADDSGKPNFG